MKTTQMLYVILVVTAVVLSESSVNDRKFSNDTDYRIIGGRNAHEGEFPFAVSLNDRRSGRHFCGGAIIDDLHVVTAAHCIYGKSKAIIRVIAGTTTLMSVNQVKRCVKHCFVHEDYHTLIYNDISLLRMNKKFIFDGKLVSAAQLQSHLPDPDATVVAIGWGLTKVTPPEFPDTLQVVELPFVSTKVCSSLIKNKVPKEYNVVPGMICAGPMNVGKEACRGDSGGPLLLDGEVIGLVSWGSEDCSTYRFPGVYTDITFYREWIDKTLARSGGITWIWTHPSVTIISCVVCLLLGYDFRHLHLFSSSISCLLLQCSFGCRV